MDFDELLNKRVIALDAARRAAHEPSGKLSAGMLSQPIQWSVLKLIGIPDTPPDAYVLRKFARGNQVEDWFTELLDGDGVETQKACEYRNTVGFIDFFKDGTPHEVKSVTNMKFKRITQGYKTKNIPPAGPQLGHKLQVGLYALATQAKSGWLHYIASDDLRLASYEIPVEEVAGEIEDTINKVDLAMAGGYVPVFEQREPWHNIPEYAKYADWMQLSAQECMQKLERDYPLALASLRVSKLRGQINAET